MVYQLALTKRITLDHDEAVCAMKGELSDRSPVQARD